jgi:hypothetical protein
MARGVVSEQLVEAEVTHADGAVEPLVVVVRYFTDGSCSVRGHSRPIDLPPGSSLNVAIPLPP